MIMQCYTVDIDEDIGFHYILHIPDTVDYAGPLYDETILVTPAEILALYKTGHDIFLEKKKMTKAKPKEVREELDLKYTSHSLQIKMQFIVQDELVSTQVYTTPYPVNPIDRNIETIINTYTTMVKSIKIGGYGVIVDGMKSGLYDRAMNSPQIVLHEVSLGHNQSVYVPVYKSMFGAGKCDEYVFSIQETELPHIFQYTVQITKKKLAEQWIGYVIEF